MRPGLRSFRLALRKPYAAGATSARFRAGYLVSLSEGAHTGWGEASPLPGWSHRSLLETEASLRAAVDAVEHGEAVETVIESLADAPYARAALSGAWLDLQARQEGVSLAHLLAAPDAAAAQVLTNALVTDFDASAVEQSAAQAAQGGFRAVKLKVGAADPDTDLDRIRAARAGMGAGVGLHLDANGQWDHATAASVLSRAEACDIAFCEEPVAGVEAIAELGRETAVPVAVDESMRTAADASKALELGVPILVIKPQALGGPDAAVAVARLAQDAGGSVIVTSMIDSAVGLAHALHVAAAVNASAATAADKEGTTGVVHGLATAAMLADDVAEFPPVVRGAVTVPAPGIGLAPVPAHERAG